jgi:hypothetical protein
MAIHSINSLLKHVDSSYAQTTNECIVLSEVVIWACVKCSRRFSTYAIVLAFFGNFRVSATRLLARAGPTNISKATDAIVTSLAGRIFKYSTKRMQTVLSNYALRKQYLIIFNLILNKNSEGHFCQHLPTLRHWLNPFWIFFSFSFSTITNFEYRRVILGQPWILEKKFSTASVRGGGKIRNSKYFSRSISVERIFMR